MQRLRVTPERENMRKNEFTDLLREKGMTLREACTVVFLFTGVAIDPDDIQKHLNRYGTLSKAHTAIFELLFKIIRKRRKPYGQAA
jgi:hypothetical protein